MHTGRNGHKGLLDVKLDLGHPWGSPWSWQGLAFVAQVFLTDLVSGGTGRPAGSCCVTLVSDYVEAVTVLENALS